LRTERAAQESRAARELAETRGALIAELERKSAELEAFSYSVSHDLRAPLRAISGFSAALDEDFGATLPTPARDSLTRVRAAAARMEELIGHLLELSRVGAQELERGPVDLSHLAHSVLDDLQARDAARTVRQRIAPGLSAQGDVRLLRLVFENLLGNAWKFTGKTQTAEIVVESDTRYAEQTFVIKDNGAGFDMIHAHKLFRPFQRLHAAAEYPGTGVGLATVQRVIERHGGRIWAEANDGRGAAFFFTLPGKRGAQ
jgi:light-regulated signal transduction histidine kinase (bacteriophytochrome)